MQSIYLAGGCFWCIEAIFLKLKGIRSITPGYMGGVSKNPTYEEICKGRSGHAEAIKCDFDDKIISLELILEIFFVAHDPTQKNRQGNDIGTQYRSAIFYTNVKQKKRRKKLLKKQKKFIKIQFKQSYPTNLIFL